MVLKLTCYSYYKHEDKLKDTKPRAYPNKIHPSSDVTSQNTCLSVIDLFHICTILG